MKTVKILFFVFLISGTAAKAQINLIGASGNANGTIEIMKWQALDSASLTTYPSSIQGYYMASSAFDAFNSNYYLGGVA